MILQKQVTETSTVEKVNICYVISVACLCGFVHPRVSVQVITFLLTDQ